MAHKTLIGGTAYEIVGGKTLIGGTAYEIKGGNTLVGGTGYEIPFSKGILASDLAVGSSVYLMENGSPVEYLVIHNGLPSSLYDSSCDGIWLLRKNIYTTYRYRISSSNADGSNVSSYHYSDIHTYLNNTFWNVLDANTKNVVKEVKIPYGKFSSASWEPGVVVSGSGGLTTKAFLLSAYELGWTQSQIGSEILVDGKCLSYFSGLAFTDSKRIANHNGSATRWWTRSPYNYSGQGMLEVVSTKGAPETQSYNSTYGVRPSLILPDNALFDPDTMQLVG